MNKKPAAAGSVPMPAVVARFGLLAGHAVRVGERGPSVETCGSVRKVTIGPWYFGSRR